MIFLAIKPEMLIKLNCVWTKKELEQFAYKSFLEKQVENEIRNERQVIKFSNVYDVTRLAGEHTAAWATVSEAGRCWFFRLEDA